MHWIDSLVVVGYLVLTFAVGLYLAAGVRNPNDYFLAGRRLPFWAIGMSLVVSDIGALEMIGGTGAAFRHGVAQANYEWIGCVPAMIVGGLVFVPVFWRLGIHSIPEYLGSRFGPVVRTVLALVWLVFLGAAVGVFFNASAEMFVTVLGWERWFTLSLVAVLVTVYTVGGGLAAVVYTDVIQCIVLFVGGLVLAGVGLVAAGGPAQVAAALPEAHTRLLLGADENPDFPWTGVLFGLGLVLSPAYWLGNQAIVQRTLGARSVWDAKASMLFGAFLKTFVPLAFVLPGMLGLVLLEGVVTDPERVYPLLIEELLPIGLRGVLYAAFLAALMSSVDSYANSAATIFTRDLYHRVLRRSAGHDLLVGRLAAAGTIGLGLLFAPWLQRDIYEKFQTILSFFQGPSLVLLLAGVGWPRANPAGGLAALLAGLAAAVAGHLAGQHFLHVAVWSFLVSALGMVAGTWLTAPRNGGDR